jgi:KDO2-lipid IV(A) lauroyltransferase
MTPGPAMLALRTGAMLVPGFGFREKDDHFVADIWEPLALERTGNLKEDLRLNTQRVAATLEAAIRARPEQWVVFKPVWTEDTTDG